MDVRRCVIASVPHCKCVSEYRDCDQRAEETCRRLITALEKYPVDTLAHYATDPREDYDNNRSPARKLEWRKKLKEMWLKSAKNYQRVFCIDVHSYITLTNPKYKCDFTQWDVCVMDDVIREPSFQLASDLQNAGIKACVVEGTEVNDIMMEAREHSLPSIMVEINESYKTFPDERLQIAVDVIAKWLVSQVSQ